MEGFSTRRVENKEAGWQEKLSKFARVLALSAAALGGAGAAEDADARSKNVHIRINNYKAPPLIIDKKRPDPRIQEVQRRAQERAYEAHRAYAERTERSRQFSQQGRVETISLNGLPADVIISYEAAAYFTQHGIEYRNGTLFKNGMVIPLQSKLEGPVTMIKIEQSRTNPEVIQLRTKHTDPTTERRIVKDFEIDAALNFTHKNRW